MLLRILLLKPFLLLLFNYSLPCSQGQENILSMAKHNCLRVVGINMACISSGPKDLLRSLKTLP